MEGSIVFGVQAKTWTPIIGASSILKIVKHELELRKLWPSKVEGVKNSKKQTTKCYKAHPHSPKKFLVFFLYGYESCKIICRIEGGPPVAL